MSRDHVREQQETLRNLVLGLPDRVAGAYRDEIDYLEHNSANEFPTFPYRRIRQSTATDAGYDSVRKLSYVMHGGSRLYAPADFTVEEAEKAYHSFVEVEGLLGTGCLEKSPHSYVDRDFRVEEGDVVVDIGCSEGLFALDCAQKAGSIYLFECCPRWRPALEATFQPFAKKTRIINKLVSNRTRGKEIRLDDAIKDSHGKSYFIKMDIEGGERAVLDSSRDFLKNNKVKLSCCVYHRQDDAEVIGAMLTDLGFKCRFSNGVMLPLIGGIRFPYFRPGVIYA